LNVFQFVELKAPVVVLDDKPKLNCCTDNVKPLAVPIVTALCLAAVFAATVVLLETSVSKSLT
jgi:hypothetical protein